MSEASNLGNIADKARILSILQGLEGTWGPALRLWVTDAAGMPVFGAPMEPAIGHAALAAQAVNAGQHLVEENSAAIPIRMDESFVGALVGASPQGGLPPVSTLDAWAHIVGAAISSELEKHALAQELIHRYAEMNLLYSIGETIGSCLDLDQVVDLVLQESGRIISAGKGAVILLDEDSRTPSIKASYALTMQDRAPLIKIASKVLHTSIVEVIDGERMGAQRSPLQSVLCTPLRGKSNTLGAIVLANKEPDNFFTASDTKLLLALSRQAATAIENARLYSITDQELTSRLGELYILQEIDRQLNASLDPHQVLDISLDWALQSTQAVSGIIAVIEPERGARILSDRGYTTDAAAPTIDGPWFQKGAAGRAIRQNEPVLIPELPRMGRRNQSWHGIRSQLAVPIQRERKPIGVICLESPEPGGFDSADLEFIVRLADHATVAIENAWLFESVKQANEAKSEFVSTVAHELKVPMTAIKGFVGLMEQGIAGPVSAKQIEYLDIVKANVDRMVTLINDLLDIAHLEAGVMQLSMARVLLRDTIQKVIQSLQNRLDSKRQELVCDIPSALRPLWADPDRLEQVLVNLLDNASKYTPVGGRIEITAREESLPNSEGEEREVQVVSIRDNGIGIAEADRQRLFTKFFRADHAAVREEDGTGLGLSIVNRLVKAHNGSMWVESELEQGSTFSFALPISEPQPKQDL